MNRNSLSAYKALMFIRDRAKHPPASLPVIKPEKEDEPEQDEPEGNNNYMDDE